MLRRGHRHLAGRVGSHRVATPPGGSSQDVFDFPFESLTFPSSINRELDIQCGKGWTAIFATSATFSGLSFSSNTIDSPCG